MDKLSWCLKQKDGISLIEPSQNLAEAYIRKAEDSLESMRVNIIKEWKISTAYYTMYFSLYALLMRIGVKCEIHSCTLEFARLFLKEYLNEEEIEFLKDSLKARVDSQYYVDRTVPDNQFEEMIKKAPRLHVKCKTILLQLNEDEIKGIRRKLARKEH
jgi:uncharacterized protein (UPF0332 family)